MLPVVVLVSRVVLLLWVVLLHVASRCVAVRGIVALCAIFVCIDAAACYVVGWLRRCRCLCCLFMI